MDDKNVSEETELEVKAVEETTTETAAIEGEIIHHSSEETAETDRPRTRLRALIEAIWEQQGEIEKQAAKYQQTFGALANTVLNESIFGMTETAVSQIMVGGQEIAHLNERIASLVDKSDLAMRENLNFFHNFQEGINTRAMDMIDGFKLPDELFDQVKAAQSILNKKCS